ncbi:MAG: carboxypeptidase regulatory-like domain-containing protein [Bacteroidaceae bacterium]|nr:carboxypeptidase regulatory-like domain-containing protein [Bacteroidaceae bacterium]
MKQKLLPILMLLLGAIAPLSAQNQVTGKVVDGNGNPVMGAKVSVPYSNKFVLSDPDGTFVLDVPASTDRVMVEYVGLGSQLLNISPNMQIVMKDKSQSEGGKWSPFVGLNATFGKELNRPVYGAMLGALHNNFGFYIRAAFFNHPYDKEVVAEKMTYTEKHKFYAVTVGGLARIYKPLFLNLGVGFTKHNKDIKATYPSTLGESVSYDFLENHKAHVCVDLGLSLKVSHFMLNGGTLYEANKAAASEWYPYVGLNYCF